MRPGEYFHAVIDPHRHQSRLSEIILGGQDGLVNVLGVILGVAAATSDIRVVLAAGLAATFAESISMAAVAFTSARADQAIYESERAREHRHVRTVPDLEREEVRTIFRQKGLSGPLLERVVEAITADPEVWVAVMMSEELMLTPMSARQAVKSAFVVGLAALIGSLIPIAPFAFLPVWPAMICSVAVAALTLFVVGAYKAITTVGSWLLAGLEMMLIGIISALVGYGIGLLFKVPGG